MGGGPTKSYICAALITVDGTKAWYSSLEMVLMLSSNSVAMESSSDSDVLDSPS